MNLALILTAVGVGIATMAVSITAIGIMFGMYRQINPTNWRNKHKIS